MKLKELISKFGWEEVRDKLLELYDKEDSYHKVKECLEGYHMAFTQLKDICNDFDFKVAMKLQVAMAQPILPDDEPYAHVSGIPDDGHDSYAMEYTPWGHWVNMHISDDSLKNFDELSILTHMLWEMTFNGFDSDTTINNARELFADLEKQVEEIENGTAELHSWEDIKKEMNERFGIEDE